MHQTYETTTVPLRRLRFGNEFPGGNVNVRHHHPDEAADLVASIRAEGVLQSLLVMPNGKGDELYVVAGGRRLTALRELQKKGEISEEFPVPAIIAPTLEQAAALGKSLAENDLHLPPHPVDRYEAFAVLAKAKPPQTAEQIAARFGCAVRTVQQALALGLLSDKVRAAWRAGEIESEAAKAFTLATSTKAQDAILAKLQKRGEITRWQVRQEVGAADADAARYVTFIGAEAYREAGGVVTEDLFEGGHIVADAGLAHSLARNRLERECQQLISDGWAWAELAEDIEKRKDRYQFQEVPKKGTPTPDEEKRLAQLQTEQNAASEASNWPKEEALGEQLHRLQAGIRARAFTAKERAKLGCIVEISDDGALDIQYGVNRPTTAQPSEAAIARARAGDVAGGKPGDKKKKTTKNGAAETEEPAELSQALRHDLSQQLTLAAADALDQDPDLALCIMLAAVRAGSDDYGDVRIRIAGLRASKDDGSGDPFEDATFKNLFARFRGKKLGELQTEFAKIIGDALQFNVLTRDEKDDPDAAGIICDAINPASLAAALKKHFNAADYFARAAKSHCLTALREATGADVERMWQGRKKAEIVAACSDLVPKTTWLPPELRTKHYQAPKLTAAATTAAAPKTPAKTAGGKKAAKKIAIKAAAKTAPPKGAATKNALRGEPRSSKATKAAMRRVRK